MRLRYEPVNCQKVAELAADMKLGGFSSKRLYVSLCKILIEYDLNAIDQKQGQTARIRRELKTLGTSSKRIARFKSNFSDAEFSHVLHLLTESGQAQAEAELSKLAEKFAKESFERHKSRAAKDECKSSAIDAGRKQRAKADAIIQMEQQGFPLSSKGGTDGGIDFGVRQVINRWFLASSFMSEVIKRMTRALGEKSSPGRKSEKPLSTLKGITLQGLHRRLVGGGRGAMPEYAFVTRAMVAMGFDETSSRPREFRRILRRRRTPKKPKAGVGRAAKNDALPLA